MFFFWAGAVTYTNLALATIGTSLGRLTAVDHDGDNLSLQRSHQGSQWIVRSEKGMPRGGYCLGF